MSWFFLDKGPRIPARYAVDYEDGMCVTFTAELGYTVGSFRSSAAYCRPDADGGKRWDIDDEGQGKGEVSLSPLYFLGGLLLVLAIVLAVVVLNCLKIARENPVVSLKNE